VRVGEAGRVGRDAENEAEGEGRDVHRQRVLGRGFAGPSRSLQALLTSAGLGRLACFEPQ
jgi:hypothetical protein